MTSSSASHKTMDKILGGAVGRLESEKYSDIYNLKI
jgi:hypothetical protein